MARAVLDVAREYLYGKYIVCRAMLKIVKVILNFICQAGVGAFAGVVDRVALDDNFVARSSAFKILTNQISRGVATTSRKW
jgi:hypothetical protein